MVGATIGRPLPVYDFYRKVKKFQFCRVKISRASRAVVVMARIFWVGLVLCHSLHRVRPLGVMGCSAPRVGRVVLANSRVSSRLAKSFLVFIFWLLLGGLFCVNIYDIYLEKSDDDWG